MERPLSTPDDREFIYWHRVGSEALIAAATHDQRVPEQLEAALDYGRRALLAGTNVRERMLAMGLLMTVEAIRTLRDVGLESIDRH